jgi:hypothetical protein
MPRRAIYQRLLASDPDAVRANRRAQYRRHKDKETADHKKWAQRPDVAQRRSAEIAARLASDPQAALRKVAKDILSRSMGVSQTALPEALVEAECTRLLLRRALKAHHG